MKLYGAGSLEDIKLCSQLGVEGILTNPQGFEQYFEGEKTLEEITEAIVSVTDLPVFIQIHGKSAQDLIERACKLRSISSQIGFKIISDPKGFRAIKRLQKEGVNCIATALFTIPQATIAATVGAFGVCPFVARARAIGMDPQAILEAIVNGYNRLDRSPQIIAVSLRNIGDIELAISTGVDAIGIRYPLIEEMVHHPLSERAEVLFAKNWATISGEDVSYLNNDN